MSDPAANADSESVSELENLRLQNEKLALEISGMRRAFIVDGIVRLAPLFTILIALAGFGFSTKQYLGQQNDTRVEQRLKRQSQEEDSRREFMKPLLAKRLDIYLDALEKAATLATAEDEKVKRSAKAHFDMLFYGPMVFVEDREVSQAMIAFKNSPTSNKSLALASALRKSYFGSLRFTPEQWQAQQEDYEEHERTPGP
jgi:hypothetical protein